MNSRIRLCVFVYIVLFGLSIWIATERGIPTPAGEMAASALASPPE